MYLVLDLRRTINLPRVGRKEAGREHNNLSNLNILSVRTGMSIASYFQGHTKPGCQLTACNFHTKWCRQQVELILSRLLLTAYWMCCFTGPIYNFSTEILVETLLLHCWLCLHCDLFNQGFILKFWIQCESFWYEKGQQLKWDWNFTSFGVISLLYWDYFDFIPLIGLVLLLYCFELFLLIKSQRQLCRQCKYSRCLPDLQKLANFTSMAENQYSRAHVHFNAVHTNLFLFHCWNLLPSLILLQMLIPDHCALTLATLSIPSSLKRRHFKVLLLHDLIKILSQASSHSPEIIITDGENPHSLVIVPEVSYQRCMYLLCATCKQVKIFWSWHFRKGNC